LEHEARDDRYASISLNICDIYALVDADSGIRRGKIVILGPVAVLNKPILGGGGQANVTEPPE
jgi:hypothetical protein